jgi:hypothetical protein
MKKELYLCNGRILNSYDECEQYANSLAMRITNTETIRTKKGTRYIVTINK